MVLIIKFNIMKKQPKLYKEIWRIERGDNRIIINISDGDDKPYRSDKDEELSDNYSTNTINPRIEK